MDQPFQTKLLFWPVARLCTSSARSCRSAPPAPARTDPVHVRPGSIWGGHCQSTPVLVRRHGVLDFAAQSRIALRPCSTRRNPRKSLKAPASAKSLFIQKILSPSGGKNGPKRARRGWEIRRVTSLWSFRHAVGQLVLFQPADDLLAVILLFTLPPPFVSLRADRFVPGSPGAWAAQLLNGRPNISFRIQIGVMPVAVEAEAGAILGHLEPGRLGLARAASISSTSTPR